MKIYTISFERKFIYKNLFSNIKNILFYKISSFLEFEFFLKFHFFAKNLKKLFEKNVNIPKIRLTRTLGPPYADSWWSADPYLRRVERMSISTSQNTSTGWWLQGCHTSPRILPWACPRARVAFGNSNTIKKIWVSFQFTSFFPCYSLLKWFSDGTVQNLKIFIHQASLDISSI